MGDEVLAGKFSPVAKWREDSVAKVGEDKILAISTYDDDDDERW
jgi:hypothetical protein